MTEPTPAQFEEAGKAFWKMLNLGGSQDEALKAALTAATEVEQDWPSPELVRDLVASATEEDKATLHFPLGKPAAADVGERQKEADRRANEGFADAIRDNAIAATIEDCAQVIVRLIANSTPNERGRLEDALSAIRAKKDKLGSK